MCSFGVFINTNTYVQTFEIIPKNVVLLNTINIIYAIALTQDVIACLGRNDEQAGAVHLGSKHFCSKNVITKQQNVSKLYVFYQSYLLVWVGI